MLKCIKRSYSFVGVNYQQLLYQIYDLLRARLELCMLEMEVAGRDLIEHFIPILSLEWQVTAHENIQQHAKGPYVTLVIVMAFEHFGGHVVWSARNTLQLLITLCSLR